MRTRMVTVITRRRAAIAVVVVVGGALLVAAAPVRNLDLGFPVIESLPDSYEAKRAADAAAQGFAPGVLSPTVVLLEGEGLTEQRSGLDRLQGLLAGQRGVAGVAGPANLPSSLTAGAVLAPSADAARYIIVFDEDPLGATAINDLQRIRTNMPALLAEAGVSGATASFAGDTALAATTVTATEADLAIVILVATGLGFLLVVVFLRAIVAPLYLTAPTCSSSGSATSGPRPGVGRCATPYGSPYGDRRGPSAPPALRWQSALRRWRSCRSVPSASSPSPCSSAS